MCKHTDKIGQIYYTNKLSKKITIEYNNNERIKLIKKEMIINENNNIFKLYDYQEKIINIANQYYINNNNNSGILSLPCGTGKTLISCYIGMKFKIVIMITPLKQYAQQNINRFLMYENNRKSLLIDSDGTRNINIINEFIKSGLLFNENISVQTLVNIKSTKKDEIFNEAKLELRILNGKISFDKSVFINNNIGLMEISNSDLFLDNDKLFLSSNLSIDIKNIDKLYSFLNTSKNLRKNIRNIKLNIIYDFLSNQVKFKNIRINDNDVNFQFNNIAEGFIDINSNNLTKSRKLLNELINLYAG